MISERGNAGDRERQLQHQREPEHRHRLTEERERGHRIVGDRIRLERGVNPQRHADEQRDDDCRAHERQRRRHPIEDRIAHRHRIRGRVAEVAGDDAAQPMQILDVYRLIEPQVMFESRDVGFGDVRVLEIRRERTAGRLAEDPEEDDGDQQQQRDILQRSSDDVREQGRTSGTSVNEPKPFRDYAGASFGGRGSGPRALQLSERPPERPFRASAGCAAHRRASRSGDPIRRRCAPPARRAPRSWPAGLCCNRCYLPNPRARARPA